MNEKLTKEEIMAALNERHSPDPVRHRKASSDPGTVSKCRNPDRWGCKV